MSGLGKGIVTSSILKILDVRGVKAIPMKFDGYLNVDCGTMNPFRHGEVFVLEDGSEVDMDFGTYERFLGKNLDGESSLTGGKIFKKIIEDEREGKFLGEDVQFIPHVTNYIKDYLKSLYKKKNADVVLIEVGGTVGDIENTYFIEALRQLSLEEDVLFIQLTYLPKLGGILKTKPTQHANRLIQSFGIKPNIIILRMPSLSYSSSPSLKISKEVIKKISLFCSVKEENIFLDPDLDFTYELPLVLEEQGINKCLEEFLGKLSPPNWESWKKRVESLKNPSKELNIALVGKYTKVKDAYISIEEALIHASAELGVRVRTKMLESSAFENHEALKKLEVFDGIIIPGGFGKRGIEGKINVIEYCRENKKPILGLCLGMQLMVIEYFRNVLGIKQANSLEFEETEWDVITLLPEQRLISKKGGTMRLGGYEMEIKEGTELFNAYKKRVVIERHRHRYEVNPKFSHMIKGELIVSATYNKRIVEAVEYKEGFGIGTQAHPELSSKFEKPSPLFLWFLRKSMLKKDKAN